MTQETKACCSDRKLQTPVNLLGFLNCTCQSLNSIMWKRKAVYPHDRYSVTELLQQRRHSLCKLQFISALFYMMSLQKKTFEHLSVLLTQQTCRLKLDLENKFNLTLVELKSQVAKHSVLQDFPDIQYLHIMHLHFILDDHPSAVTLLAQLDSTVSQP